MSQHLKIQSRVIVSIRGDTYVFLLGSGRVSSPLFPSNVSVVVARARGLYVAVAVHGWEGILEDEEGGDDRRRPGDDGSECSSAADGRTALEGGGRDGGGHGAIRVGMFLLKAMECWIVGWR